MEDRNYIEQLKDIRTLMDRSSRFVSLSGLSGVLAGVYAIIGAYCVQYVIAHRRYYYITLESREFYTILLIAGAVMGLSIVTAIVLSRRKALRSGVRIWNSASRRLVLNFSIPLLTGGIFGFSLLYKGHFGLIAPITMIFYGLSLVNASKYTFETVRYLGVAFIALGLVTVQYPGNSLLFWTIGFGLFHIVYGTFMYLQFDRKAA